MKKYLSLALIATAALAQAEVAKEFQAAPQDPILKEAFLNELQEKLQDKEEQITEAPVQEEVEFEEPKQVEEKPVEKKPAPIIEKVIKVNNDGTLNIITRTVSEGQEHIHRDTTEHTLPRLISSLAGGVILCGASFLPMPESITTDYITQKNVSKVLKLAALASMGASGIFAIKNYRATGNSLQQINKTSHTIYSEEMPNLGDSSFPQPNANTEVTVVSSKYPVYVRDSKGMRLQPPSEKTDQLKEDVRVMMDKADKIRVSFN